MRIVKGILIDPFACTVTEIERDADSIDNIYPLLSHETKKVHTFRCAYSQQLAPGDAIFVDNEGMLGPAERFFLFPGLQPIAGKGLILGSDASGQTVSAATSPFYANYATMFLRRDGDGLAPTVQEWEKTL